MRCVFFDIETSNLKANFAVLLTAAFKPLDKPAYVFTGTKGANDRELCKRIKEELEKYDIIITYYGLGFDMKFLNSRLMYWGLEPVRQTLHIDVYRLARKIFATHSNRLEAITQFLHIPGKTHIVAEDWVDAAYNGDKAAINRIAEHNKADVEILETLFMRHLRRTVKSVSLA